MDYNISTSINPAHAATTFEDSNKMSRHSNTKTSTVVGRGVVAFNQKPAFGKLFYFKIIVSALIFSICFPDYATASQGEWTWVFILMYIQCKVFSGNILKAKLVNILEKNFQLLQLPFVSSQGKLCVAHLFM